MMDAKEKIVDAFNLATQKSSFIIETESLNEFSVSKSKLKIFAALPDYKIILFGPVNKEIGEIISVGDNVYKIIFGLGDWEISSKTDNDNLRLIQEYKKRAKLIRKVEYVGEDELDGVAVSLYQYDFYINLVGSKQYLPASKDIKNNKIKIWIDSTGLPKRMEYRGQLFGAKNGELTKTIERFTFDQNIIIKTPKI